MHPYLEAARERVVVYDGATGTNLQARDLSADDFGGPALEGCNEVLVDTRPDVVADLHRSFFEVGSDLVETCYDLLQAKAAMVACRRAMAAVGREVPLQVQVTMETTGRMLVGTEIGAALTALSALNPDVFGLNCATGPVEMSEHLRHLS